MSKKYTLILSTIFLLICNYCFANSSASPSQNIHTDSILQSLLNLSGWLFGIVSMIITIHTWRTTKNDQKTYAFLFDAAKKNIDLDVTNKTIQQKKDEIEKYSNQIIKLQESIRDQITIAAQHAVLSAKLNAQVDLLAQTYQSIEQIKAKLPENQLNLDIPPEILKTIESEINPEYFIREQRAKWKSYITVITTAVAIVSTFLPYPFDWVSYPLLLAVIPYIIKLLLSYLPTDVQTRKQIILKFAYRTSFVVSIISFISVVLAISMPNYYLGYGDTRLMLFGVSSLLVLVFSVMGLVFRIKYKRCVTQQKTYNSKD